MSCRWPRWEGLREMPDTMTAHLDGAIRDGRHHMQIRVYYEDTDFPGTLVSEYDSPCASMTSFVVRRDGKQFGLIRDVHAPRIRNGVAEGQTFSASIDFESVIRCC
jgi:hypothetical protein